jgi:hypothetical protein
MPLESVTAVSVGQVYVGMNSNTGTRFAPAGTSQMVPDPQKSYASLYWTNSNTDAHTVVVTVSEDVLGGVNNSSIATFSQNVYKLKQGASGFVVPLHITSSVTQYDPQGSGQYFDAKTRYLISVGISGDTFPSATVTTVVYQPFYLNESNLNSSYVAAGINAAVVSVQNAFQIGLSQTADRSVVVSVPFLQVSGFPTMPGIILCTDAVEKVDPGEVENFYRVRLLDFKNNEIYDAHHPPSINGRAFSVTIPAATVVSTGNHTVIVEIATCLGGTFNGVDYKTNQFILQKMYSTAETTLTAGATVTSGESSNMYTWLDNSYWYLTDLQVNLGTREVTHRHGTIQFRPSDTINFAILFHDGTAGIDPQATDIKLAVRSSNNTSPYHFWSAATVSTVTVSGDVYYAITVTASDDDLLTAQATNLLAGSNAAQTLLGEIQWTTTRGTFSSDTFTINVPSEVVREPDV